MKAFRRNKTSRVEWLFIIGVSCIAVGVADIAEALNAPKLTELKQLRREHADAAERIAYLETILEARGIVVDAHECEINEGPLVQPGPTLLSTEKEQE